MIRIRNTTLVDRLFAGFQTLVSGRRPRLLDRDMVLIPQDCMLDLWQSVRGYGFCTARMMPEGLDVLAPYLMPLLAKLSYMSQLNFHVTGRVLAN